MTGFNADKVNTGQQDTGTGAGAAKDAIDNGTRKEEEPASPEEQDERRRHFLTQGKKGCKMHRLNLSVTPDNLDWLHVTAGIQGKSMSLVVNDLLTAARAADKTYKQAKKLQEEARKNGR